MKQLSLGEGLWLSCAILVTSSAVAFWPAPRWVPPPRPTLKAPIVLDELVQHSPPPSEPGTAP